jgi:NAD(P)H-hydrate epimerase
MQTANPEAMVMVDESETELTGYTDYSKFAAIGVGPGIGKDPKTANFVENLLRTNHRPMVIDADALNIISDMHYLRPLISPGSVLTPHPGEFKRLQGAWKDDMAKIQKQIALSKQSRIVIVLKGANTSISTPDGKVYFNSTGNPGMAKGGSGDVLTGIITALLAQGYSPENAAILGTFIHGRAGDIAAAALGVTGIKAGDIIQFLPEAFAAFE